MPRLYLDQNVLIQMGYGKLPELKKRIESREIQLVLSPAHWLDTARGDSEENSRMLARFIDALRPVWLRDPVGLQRLEIDAYLRGIPSEQFRTEAVCSTVSELIAEIGGTVLGGAAILSTEAIVMGLRNNQESRAIFAKSYATNLESNRKNGKRLRAGKFTAELQEKCRLAVLRQRSGIKPGSHEDTLLRNIPWSALRSLACEEETSKLMWELTYEMNPNQLHDLWHLVVAMPYTDFMLAML